LIEVAYKEKMLLDIEEYTDYFNKIFNLIVVSVQGDTYPIKFSFILQSLVERQDELKEKTSFPVSWTIPTLYECSHVDIDYVNYRLS
jgi:hypothetical protein